MFLKTIGQALKRSSLRKRLLFTFFILVLFRVGAHVTTPGINADALQLLGSIGILQSLSLISGNAFKNFSLFALGVSPYISASILVQILQMDVIPILTEWSKQGESGRRHLNKVTRWLTLILAVFQGYGTITIMKAYSQYEILRAETWQVYAIVLLTICAGSLVLTWLAEQITDRGIGNGQTMMIVAGILATLPDFIQQMVTTYATSVKWDWASKPMWTLIGLTVAMVLVFGVFVWLTVFVHQAEYRIPIQYMNRSQLYGDSSYLPLKLNPSGVIPVIFASVLMTIPTFIQNIFHVKASWYLEAVTFFDMTRWRGMAVYGLFIILFAIAYAYIQIGPEKTKTQLAQSASYIVNVRPGDETERYFERLLWKLGLLGGIGLMIVACLPLALSKVLQTSMSFVLTGTSLLIVIAGALDVTNQLKGFVMKRHYEELL